MADASKGAGGGMSDCTHGWTTDTTGKPPCPYCTIERLQSERDQTAKEFQSLFDAAGKMKAELESERDALKRECEALKKLRPLNEWHEEIGSAIWWLVPIEEPPWVGTPLDSDWPGYHTHWSKIPDVAALSPAEPKEQECQCDMRTKLVGDGCPVCNPGYWEQFTEPKENGDE